jgi:hypothetical protein
MSLRLTSFEITLVQRSLETQLEKVGPDILGAQLGQFVRRAISPKTIKSVGGLKSLVDVELSEVVELVGALESDTLYRIKAPSHGTLHGAPNPVAVTSPEFWDAFSNPNIDCLVGVDPACETVFVCNPSKVFGPEIKPLSKVSSEEYRALAKTYAEQQADGELTAILLETLDHPIFYPRWIAALRAQRTASANHLKKWEIMRTELVIDRLRHELEQAGVHPDRAHLIANEVRPKPSKSPRKLGEKFSPPQDRQPEAFSPAPAADVKGLQDLRALMHRAVDRMTLADLKDIRVPAGLLLEIYQNPAD